jgi:prefoldin subunit 5
MVLHEGMGFLTFANTREIKAQNRELQKQLENLTSKLDVVLGRLSKVETAVEDLKSPPNSSPDIR